MHINEGKDKLALFSTKYNVLLTPHPSYSSSIDLFSLFLILLFIFNFHPRPHLPYIDPTSTPHRPHTNPTLNFFPHHMSTVFLRQHHHVFLMFPSTATTIATFPLFSLLHHHHHRHQHISIVSPPPPPPPPPHF